MEEVGLDQREGRVAAFRGLEVDLLQLVAAALGQSDWQQLVGVAVERAAMTGKADFFRRALRASGIDVRNWRGLEGQPLLRLAACGANEDVVLAVLESGGQDDVDERASESKRRSALHLAAERGYNEVCRVLVTAGGADINLKDGWDNTPLHLALSNRHGTLVFDLLRWGARVDVTDDSGNLPLHLASQEDYGPIVSALLANDGALIVNNTNMWGHTPLYWAVCTGQVDPAERLLAAGAVMYLPHEHPMLHNATAEGYVDMSRALLARGADARSIGVNGWTALHTAARIKISDEEADRHVNQAEVFQTLLEAGADVDAQDLEMQTPLHHLCGRKVSRVDSLQVLLRAGAGVNAAQSDGKTPLHLACAHLNEQVVEVLLACGAALTAVDNNGNTPAQVVGSSTSPGNQDSAVTLAHKTASVRDMLARAPADRAWRRRGWLVMCRHRAMIPPLPHGEGLVSTPPPDYGQIHEKKIKTNQGASVGAGRGGDAGKESSSAKIPPDPFEELVTAVFSLSEEGVFRTVAGFL